MTQLTAVDRREKFSGAGLAADHGETSLVAVITAPGSVSAGTYKGKFYFKGMLIEQEP
jgi:hypothetical protein